jgi:hypothetical protein
MYLLKALDVQPDSPLSLLEIGPPLVAQGYSQDDILEGLLWLQSEGRIRLLEGNRLSKVQHVSARSSAHP